MALTERYVSSSGVDTWANATSASTPASWATMLTDAIAGDRVNIKQDGTYTLGASSAMTGVGTTTSPIILRGYKTAIGDGNQGRTGANGALVTTNMPVIAYDATFGLSIGAFTILESLNVSSNNSAPCVTLGTNCLVRSCKAINASTNASAIGIAGNTNAVIFDCDAQLTGASGGSAAVANQGTSGVRVLCNRISGGPAIGVNCTTNHVVIAGNLIFASTTNHIKVGSAGAPITILFNTLVGATSTGILMTTGSTNLSAIVGNMITDNGAYGMNWVSAAGAGLFANNRFRDNTSGDVNLGTDWRAAATYGEVTTDTGGPETDYTNSGAGDYTLISASPAKAAGWLPYMDIGALQRQEAGGGAARRFVQNL